MKQPWRKCKKVSKIQVMADNLVICSAHATENAIKISVRNRGNYALFNFFGISNKFTKMPTFLVLKREAFKRRRKHDEN